MDPLTALMIAQGLLDLYLKLQPTLAQAFSSGAITVEQQAALRAQIDAIRSGEAFQGPEWVIDASPPTAQVLPIPGTPLAT